MTRRHCSCEGENDRKDAQNMSHDALRGIWSWSAMCSNSSIVSLNSRSLTICSARHVEERRLGGAALSMRLARMATWPLPAMLIGLVDLSMASQLERRGQTVRYFEVAAEEGFIKVNIFFL